MSITSVGASSDLTGWAQTIVAVLGFAAAVSVPTIQRRNENKDRKIDAARRGRALAFKLLPEIEDWLDRFALVESEQRSAGAHRPYEAFLTAVTTVDVLAVPEVVDFSMDSLHLLGWVGDQLFDALSECLAGRASAYDVDDQVLHVDDDPPAKAAVAEIMDNFYAAHALLVSVRAELQELTGRNWSRHLDALHQRIGIPSTSVLQRLIRRIRALRT